MTITEALDQSASQLKVIAEFADKHEGFLANKHHITLSVAVCGLPGVHLHLASEGEARAYFGDEGWNQHALEDDSLKWIALVVDGVEVIVFL